MRYEHEAVDVGATGRQHFITIDDIDTPILCTDICVRDGNRDQRTAAWLDRACQAMNAGEPDDWSGT